MIVMLTSVVVELWQSQSAVEVLPPVLAVELEWRLVYLVS